MKDPESRLAALFVAAHAVAETRLGPPYDLIEVTDGPVWPEPERPLTWRSDDEASELILRLAVGFAAVVALSDAGETRAATIAERDLQGIADVVQALHGQRPSAGDVSTRAREVAEPFLRDDANARAIEMVEQQLLALGGMDMHEVDFLVEAADGDEDALEYLDRYRSAFSGTRVPWPDST